MIIGNAIEQGIYAIKDLRADATLPWFSADNDDLAQRHLMEGVLVPEGLIAKFPADFVLYKIGFINRRHMTMKELESPEVVMTAQQALEAANH